MENEMQHDATAELAKELAKQIVELANQIADLWENHGEHIANLERRVYELEHPEEKERRLREEERDEMAVPLREEEDDE